MKRSIIFAGCLATAFATQVRGQGGPAFQMERGGVQYTLHRDHIGNTRVLTNAAGQVVETYTYTDFGAPTVLNAQGEPVPPGLEVGNPRLFRGWRYDPETGFYWSGSRYYDPGTGRFTSRSAAAPSSLGLGATPDVDNVDALEFSNPRTQEKQQIAGDVAQMANAYTALGNNPWGGGLAFTEEAIGLTLIDDRRWRQLIGGFLSGSDPTGAPVAVTGNPMMLSAESIRRVRGGMALSSGGSHQLGLRHGKKATFGLIPHSLDFKKKAALDLGSDVAIEKIEIALRTGKKATLIDFKKKTALSLGFKVEINGFARKKAAQTLGLQWQDISFKKATLDFRNAGKKAGPARLGSVQDYPEGGDNITSVR